MPTVNTSATRKKTRLSKRLGSNFIKFAFFVSFWCAIYSYSEFSRFDGVGKSARDDFLATLPERKNPSLGTCRGKEKYVKVLESAGLTPQVIQETFCAQLPLESQVAELYGSEPIIHGLDNCEKYRANLKIANASSTRFLAPKVRVTGLFNTGTNAFHTALHANLLDDGNKDNKISDPHGIETLYEVPWFKHFPVEARNDWIKGRDPDTVNSILTIVLVRDPYRWMQSMCKASYTVQWKRVRGHCPNLVPSAAERKARPRMRHAPSFPVSATFGEKYTQDYESLASMWSKWNREYFEADFPRLFVRFEDVIFNAEQVMSSVADCAGLLVRQPYSVMIKPSKGHGNSSGLLSAMIKYGTDAGRSNGLLSEDLEYSEKVLDKELMALFHYERPKLVQHAKEDNESL